jgi:hypothetical protein
VDHLGLICPCPLPLILLDGCNTNGCSLLCALPTGSLLPQQIGLVAPCAKTNRPQGCSRLLHVGGQFLPEVTLARRPPTNTGRGPWINCGRTSTNTIGQWPANASLTSTPPTNTRRLLVVNNFLTRKPFINDRRLLIANAFLTSTLPRNKGWPNVPP